MKTGERRERERRGRIERMGDDQVERAVEGFAGGEFSVFLQVGRRREVVACTVKMVEHGWREKIFVMI